MSQILLAIACMVAAAWQLRRVPRVWAFLLMFIVLAPKMPLVAVPGNPTPIRVDDVLIAIVLAAWVRHEWFRATNTPASSVTPFVLVYWAVALACTAIGIASLTTAPLTGVLHFGRAVEYGLLFFLFYSTIEPGELDKFVEVFRTVLLIVCGIWIAQHWTHTPGPSATLYPTFSATYDFGGYLMLATVMLYALWVVDPASRTVWTTIALAAGVFVLANADSRAALLALAVMVTADLVVRFRWRAALVIVPLAAAAPIVIQSRKMMAFVQGAFAFATSFDTAAASQVVGADRSLGLRLRNWAAAIDRWVERPLVGDGLGGYLQYARHYDEPSSIDGWYVRVLADTGLIGLLTFTMLIVALLWTLLDAYRREHRPFRRAIVYGAALAVGAASINAMLLDTFVSYKIMGVFWMIVGVGARLAAERT